MSASQPKMMVYDIAERMRIWRALNFYIACHGNIGVPTLEERMCLALDRSDEPHLDRSTMQRFVRGPEKFDRWDRIGDEKVHRYKKFLERVAPPPPEETLSTALGSLLVEGAYLPDLAPLIGRYERRDIGPLSPDVPSFVSMQDGFILAGATVQMFNEEDEAPPRELILTRGNGPDYLHAALCTYRRTSDGGDERLIGETGLLVNVPQGGYLMLLRSFLDAHVYTLASSPRTPGLLEGVFQQTASSIPRAAAEGMPWQPGRRVQFLAHQKSAEDGFDGDAETSV